MNPDEIQPRLLAVAAHPDDAEFTSGGSLARWAAEGWIVHLVVCTDGCKGSQNPGDDPSTLAELRRAEQEDAARVLRIRKVVCLGYPDGELALAAGLVEQLARQIRLRRPNRLLTWDAWRPYQLHPDHRAAGLAALDAVLAAGNPHFYPEQLTGGSSPIRWRRPIFTALTNLMSGWTSPPPLNASWQQLIVTAARWVICATWRSR